MRYFIAVVVLFCFTSIAFAEPVTLEDYEDQRNQLARLSQQVTGQIQAYDKIIDEALQQRLDAKKLQGDIVKKFKQVEAEIKKLEVKPEPAEKE